GERGPRLWWTVFRRAASPPPEGGRCDTCLVGRWCNGSTTDFGSVCPGSNPGRPVSVGWSCRRRRVSGRGERRDRRVESIIECASGGDHPRRGEGHAHEG